MSKEYSAAIITIKGAPNMTRKGRGQIAAWLRKHADWLEQDGDKYSKRFTGRYIVERLF